MLKPQVVEGASGSTDHLSYSAEIKAGEKFVTKFSWRLQDWSLLYDTTYSQGVQSDSFQLNGMNKCTCQLSINPKNSTNPLAIEFSDPTRILALKINAVCNREQEFENCYSQPVAKVIRPSGMRVPLKKYALNDLMSPNIDTRQDNSLSIEVQFTIIKFSNSHSFPCQKPQTNVLSNIKIMFYEKILCDVTFVFGNTELPAHKAILAVQSKVFETMFQSAMKEKETSRVEIVDIRAEVFAEFLKYFYTGDANDLKNMVKEMIVVADKYQVWNLKQLCQSYMLTNLRNENVVEYLIIADKLCCEALKNRAVNFLQNSAIAWVQAITNEDLESFAILKQIFSNDCPKNV